MDVLERDREIGRRLKDGTPEQRTAARWELVVLYDPMIRNIANRLAASSPVDPVELYEAAQEGLWHASGTWKPNNVSFARYGRLRATQWAMYKIRRHGVRARTEASASCDQGVEDVDPGDSLDADKMRLCATNALSCLSPKQRQVVDECIMADEPRSMSSLAREEGVCTNAIVSRKNLAVRRLRDRLSGI